MKIEPGTYDVEVTGATVYEAPSGAVMCRMSFDNGLTGGICLIQKDGTLSERGFKDVQAILGWSDWDWQRFAVDPETITGNAQIVVETVQGDRGEFSSVKYVNAPGGNRSHLERADVSSLVAKYGAKTRALLGGNPPSAPHKRTPPPVMKKPSRPMKKETLPSNMEACWEEFCKKNEGKSEPDLYDLWPKLIENATGKEQNDCSPQDWGLVMDAIEEA